MLRVTRLEPSFVGAIPEVIEQGKLYVCIEYATIVHSCCCGCGEEVVTPLTPTDWRMTFDGKSVSLSPSIGSWTLPCRSHYVVERGAVRWASSWTQQQIDSERRRDRAAKVAYFAQDEIEHEKPELEPPPIGIAPLRRRKFGEWLSAVLSQR